MKKNWIIILSVVLGLTLLVSWGVLKNLPDLPPKTVLFFTVGINQETLSNTVSPYEIHRAAEHFSNVILGWTVEPSFAAEFGTTPFTARRQEKENLLFTLSTDDSSTVNRFDDLLRERLTEYNQETSADYVLVLEHRTVIQNERADWRILMGSMLLMGLLTIGIMIAYEKELATGHRLKGSH